jgi:predicted phage tail protein
LVPPREEHVGAGQSVAMMVVGAAAIVTGAIIGGNGGTAIAVGGGVIGLVGLYRYMK